MKFYNEVLTLINGKNKWPNTTDPKIFQPMSKHGPGKAKEASQKGTKWGKLNKMAKIKYKPWGVKSAQAMGCKKCLEYGHNSRTCKKGKQLTIILDENTKSITKHVEPPTQVSQTQN